MKKLISLLICSALLLTIFACTSDEKTSADDTTDKADSENTGEVTEKNEIDEELRATILKAVDEIANNPDLPNETNGYVLIAAKTDVFSSVVAMGETAVPILLNELRNMTEDGVAQFIMAGMLTGITDIGSKDGSWTNATEWLAIYDSLNEETQP